MRDQGDVNRGFRGCLKNEAVQASDSDPQLAKSRQVIEDDGEHTLFSVSQCMADSMFGIKVVKLTSLT